MSVSASTAIASSNALANQVLRSCSGGSGSSQSIMPQAPVVNTSAQKPQPISIFNS